MKIKIDYFRELNTYEKIKPSRFTGKVFFLENNNNLFHIEDSKFFEFEVKLV